MKIDLTQQSWTLTGWRPYVWQFRKSMETQITLRPDIPAMPAKVPASAQGILRRHGWLADWNVGLDSLTCEWVEHRHWEFATVIEQGVISPGGQTILHADGLDYSGWILVDAKQVAAFSGALIRHRFDLTAALADGKRHTLQIVFDQAPAEQGQIGYTSRSKFFKPRYNYSWDWCPRVVPIGIWDAIWLEIGKPPAEVVKISTSLADDLTTGTISVWLDAAAPGAIAMVVLSRAGRKVAELNHPLALGANRFELSAPSVKPWFPSGHGEAVLYDLAISASSAESPAQLLKSTRVGFKQVRWISCEGAPTGALPWICQINGKPVFLQGVNWTPPLLDYHAITREDYAKLIDLYREMGCNVLRVWGGGYLERETFYDLCDQAGLLVWQEFPLSSSGRDNWPPEDPDVIAMLRPIAIDYIRRRAHHACKLLWCGGNELQSSGSGDNMGSGVPVPESHPLIAMLRDVVHAEDPGVRFLPTSPSGPTFLANKADFGKGRHHHVHGPWTLDGTLEEWRDYWSHDDALFRSETGAPGASSPELFERYRGHHEPWPPIPENRYWIHTGAWWLQWERFGPELKDLPAAEGLARYIEASRSLQGEALAIAAGACRSRFPRCGGIIIWMGHDCFPCSANTSIIQFDRQPKPAYFALQKVFKSEQPQTH